MDGWIGWKMNFFLGFSLFAGAMSVSGRVSLQRQACYSSRCREAMGQRDPGAPGWFYHTEFLGPKTLGTKFLASPKSVGEVSFQVFRSKMKLHVESTGLQQVFFGWPISI